MIDPLLLFLFFWLLSWLHFDSFTVVPLLPPHPHPQQQCMTKCYLLTITQYFPQPQPPTNTNTNTTATTSWNCLHAWCTVQATWDIHAVRKNFSLAPFAHQIQTNSTMRTGTRPMLDSKQCCLVWDSVFVFAVCFITFLFGWNPELPEKIK